MQVFRQPSCHKLAVKEPPQAAVDGQRPRAVGGHPGSLFGWQEEPQHVIARFAVTEFVAQGPGVGSQVATDGGQCERVDAPGIGDAGTDAPAIAVAAALLPPFSVLSLFFLTFFVSCCWWLPCRN